VIEVERLYKHYGRRRVLGPVSFRVGQGEIVGLLGLNGAGKTTTLRTLTGELLPTSGRVVLDGHDVALEPHAVRERVGYLPDVPPVYPEMTVLEYLSFAAEMRSVPRRQRKSRVDEAIAQTALSGVAQDVIGSLSLGYRQRVGVAQAIVHAPACVILDEPIRGLDPEQIVEMRSLVRSLAGRHTVVLSSHILSEVRETCQRVVVIANGEVVAEGAADELGRAGQAFQELRVRVARSAGAEARTLELLRGLSHVIRAEPASAEREDAYEFSVSASQDVRCELCRALVTEGVPLLECTQVEIGLEEAFLELVRESSAARAAGAA
jgi:ABC-2 type transport system ATP-binding protein